MRIAVRCFTSGFVCVAAVVTVLGACAGRAAGGSGDIPPRGDAANPPSDSGGTIASDGGTLDSGGDAPASSIDSGATSPSTWSDAAAFDGATTTVTITVDPTTKLGSIGPNFVGLSYEKSHLRDGYFSGDNAALIAMVDLLGPSILRVGGNSVDETVWYAFDGGLPDGSSTPATITTGDVDGLAAFAKAAGWQVLYGVNMKLSNPAVAEEEAAYANSALGASLFGFEIGNEPDLYTTVMSSPGAWTYDTFKTDWLAFDEAILADAGGAPMTGPASAAHYATWTVPFASDESAKISTLTQHYYVADGQSDASTIELLLQPNPGLVTELDALADAATTNKIQTQYRLSECNSFYNGGAPNVSDAYGTALWAIDFLFTNAEHGSSGVNFHGGGDGPGYTPIADADGGVVGARPLFYGMLLVTRAGQGDVVKTSGDPTTINFNSYAVAVAGGGTSVVLVNKDTTTGAKVTVNLGAAITSASATALQGPRLDSTTGVTLGGAEIGADGTFNPGAPVPLAVTGKSLAVFVPPATAVLVSVE